MRNATAQRRAIQLRKDTTDAERHPWHYLRMRQPSGHRFRRQVPVGPYIGDFACIEARLIVELDGGQHAEQEDYDVHRNQFLAAQGFRVLHFWDYEALNETEAVLEAILQALESSQDHVAAGQPTSHGPLK